MPYLTPDSIPNDFTYKWVRIPNDLKLIGALTGAIGTLGDAFRWEQFGTATPEETAEAMIDLLSRYLNWSGNLIGLICPYPGVNPPDGCLPCDGAEYARAAYPELYAYLIGTDLIVDSDTFTTPTFPGRVVSMADETNEPGDDYGEASHTMTEDELVSHAHWYTNPTLNVDLESPGAPDIFAAGVGLGEYTGNTGGGEPFPVYQPTRAYNWGIVAGRSYAASTPATEVTIFGYGTPAFTYGIDDATPVMLGLRFQSSVALTVTHVKTWRRDYDETGRIGYLFSNAGTLLGSGDFEDEVSTGWITAELDTPVEIDADTTYVIAAYFANGHFISSPDGMENEIVNGVLTALADGADGANCVYAYASAGTFPTSTFSSANYWLDLIGAVP